MYNTYENSQCQSKASPKKSMSAQVITSLRLARKLSAVR